MSKIIVLIINILLGLFFLSIIFALLKSDVGSFLFSLSFTLLLTVLKMIFVLIDLKFKNRVATFSKNAGRILALFLFFAGVLLLVYIFFQWWRLFFETGLKISAVGTEYRGFIGNLRILAYLNFVNFIAFAILFFRYWRNYFLILFILVILVLFGLALANGAAYLPIKFNFYPFPVIELDYALVPEPKAPVQVHYAFSRLANLMAYIPMISFLGLVLIRKAINIFKTPLMIRLGSTTAVIGFYLTIMLTEIFGFLALAMLIIKE